MSNSTTLTATTCLLLLAASGPFGSAQLSPGCSMNVLVTDQSGARVPGAIVLKTEPPTATLTGRDGDAQLWLCDASVLSAQAPGFKTTRVALAKPAPATIALTLKVADAASGFPVEATNAVDPAQPQMSGTMPASSPGASTIPPAGTTLALIGPIIQSVLTGDMLAAMPHHTITVENGHTHASETYSGVALVTVLAAIGAPSGKDVHGKALSQYVVATGADGYKAVIALAEAEPDFHPGQVLVADTLAGKPLSVKEGPFKLLVSEDKHPARSVHNLVKLELKAAE